MGPIERSINKWLEFIGVGLFAMVVCAPAASFIGIFIIAVLANALPEVFRWLLYLLLALLAGGGAVSWPFIMVAKWKEGSILLKVVCTSLIMAFGVGVALACIISSIDWDGV